MNMLEMYASADKGVNDALSLAVFFRKPLSGISFILMSDDKNVGLLELELPPFGNRIRAIGILNEFRGNGYGDFFTRAALLRLSEISSEIRISYVSDYYLKFGFRQCGEEMVVESKNLTFPSDCGGN